MTFIEASRLLLDACPGPPLARKGLRIVALQAVPGIPGLDASQQQNNAPTTQHANLSRRRPAADSVRYISSTTQVALLLGCRPAYLSKAARNHGFPSRGRCGGSGSCTPWPCYPKDAEWRRWYGGSASATSRGGAGSQQGWWDAHRPSCRRCRCATGCEERSTTSIWGFRRPDCLDVGQERVELTTADDVVRPGHALPAWKPTESSSESGTAGSADYRTKAVSAIPGLCLTAPPNPHKQPEPHLQRPRHRHHPAPADRMPIDHPDLQRRTGHAVVPHVRPPVVHHAQQRLAH